eukprot:5943484-Amphidinium_carterae.1
MDHNDQAGQTWLLMKRAHGEWNTVLGQLAVWFPEPHSSKLFNLQVANTSGVTGMTFTLRAYHAMLACLIGLAFGSHPLCWYPPFETTMCVQDIIGAVTLVRQEDLPTSLISQNKQSSQTKTS